jgi:hypothetical protein
MSVVVVTMMVVVAVVGRRCQGDTRKYKQSNRNRYELTHT